MKTSLAPRGSEPGTIHHAMVNGLHRQLLFIDDEDRRFYTKLVHESVAKASARLHCLAVLSTHAHVGVEVGPVPLSKIMKRANERYAKRFNWRWKRQGYVFRFKFKSRVVYDDVYHRNFIVYVHRNPIEAGIVSDVPSLSLYEFTAHGALMGFGSPGSIDVTAVLRLFGPNLDVARAAYYAQMEQVMDPEWREMFERFPDRWSFDNPDAVIAKDTFLERTRSALAREAAERARWEGWSLDALIDVASKASGVSRDDITNGKLRAREVSRVRGAVAFLAHVRLRLRQVEISETLGQSQSAVAQAIGRSETLALDLEVTILESAMANN